MSRLAMLMAVSTMSAVTACSGGTSGEVPAAPSDEEQIRAVLEKSFDAWNRGDAEAYAATYCAKKREWRVNEIQAGGDPDEKASVGRVTSNGDQADAEITITEDGRTETTTFPLVYEDGQWKVCS